MIDIGCGTSLCRALQLSQIIQCLTETAIYFTMVLTLGKRKRRGAETVSKAQSASIGSTEGANEDAQAIFRRHFEMHFKPLPTAKKIVKEVEDVPEDESEEATDWEGISNAEGTF